MYLDVANRHKCSSTRSTTSQPRRVCTNISKILCRYAWRSLRRCSKIGRIPISSHAIQVTTTRSSYGKYTSKYWLSTIFVSRVSSIWSNFDSIRFNCSGLQISLFKFSFLHAFVLREKHCRWIFRNNGVSIDRSADHIFFSINDFSLAFFGFLLFNEADRRYQLLLMISHSSP